MSGWTTIWTLIAVVGAISGVWVGTPKGPNQVMIRTSVALALSCMYLMWFIVYMAQLHPVIKPKRGDLRFLEE
ncbi:H(+)-transporting V0 sector ATPase subunit e [Thecaphora frezii]